MFHFKSLHFRFLCFVFLTGLFWFLVFEIMSFEFGTRCILVAPITQIGVLVSAADEWFINNLTSDCYWSLDLIGKQILQAMSRDSEGNRDNHVLDFQNHYSNRTFHYFAFHGYYYHLDLRWKKEFHMWIRKKKINFWKRKIFDFYEKKKINKVKHVPKYITGYYLRLNWSIKVLKYVSFKSTNQKQVADGNKINLLFFCGSCK